MNEEFRKILESDSMVRWIYDDARNYRPRGADYCVLDAWDGPANFRGRVVDVAGYNRAYGGPPEMRTSRAYEVVSRAILAALPHCRGDCRCGESRAAC